MNKRTICCVILFFQMEGMYVYSFPYFSLSFFQDHARGWFWHEDFEELEKLKEDAEKKKDPPPPSSSNNAQEEMSVLQNTLKELKARAILYPTVENVKSYQLFQMKVVKLSEEFSKVWLYNVIQNPVLNDMVQNPSVQMARSVVYEKEKKDIEKIILTLKEDYGLFYFYSSTCRFCESFTPIVEKFASTYGWEVVAISMDGTPSQFFSNWQTDNGISQQFKITSLPCLFAVNPTTAHVIPISHGVSSIDQMEKRIFHIVTFESKSQIHKRVQ